MQILAGTSGKRWFAATLFTVGFASIAISHAGEKIAASKDGDNPEALAGVLRESVADETVGDEKSRTAKLDSLIESQPDSPEPRWQRGMMKTGDGWSDASDRQEEVSEGETKYRELRE